MLTEIEIKNKYKLEHEELSKAFYGKKSTVGITREEQETFDIQHGQIWNDMKAELITEGYLIPPEPPRDLIAEIDELKRTVQELQVKL